MNNLIKTIAHIAFQSSKVEKETKRFANRIKSKKILEIGSGNNSSIKFFDSSNEFTSSDLNPKSKECLKLDAAKMSFKNKYDLIISINVLDDIYDYQKAVDNIRTALKKNGKVFIVVNGFYPIHDIPYDYWRFTEFSLRKIFSKFKNIKIKYLGLKRFPSYYILEAEK